MNSKRVFATILALALALTLFPVTALGAEGAGATSLTEAMFTVDTAMEVHTGRPITKTITAQDGGKVLVEGVDYTVAYADNTDIGTAKITVTGTGDYAGTLEYTFAIDVLTDSREDYLISKDGMFNGYIGEEINVVIPEGVTSLYEYASFGEAVSVTLPSTVTSIPQTAFYYGSELVSIQVNENNPVYASQDGVLFNKDKTALVKYPSAKGGAYTVPDGVKKIKSHAFGSNPYLLGVTLSDSVEQVESEAFIASRIYYVNFGGGVTQIGERAFFYCENLTGVVLPEGLTNIGRYAFAACRNLKSIIIPRSMSASYGTFSQCDALTDIYYEGSEEEWAEKIGSRSDSITYHDNYGAGATKALTEDMFTVDTGEEVYTGSPITKTITGQDGDKALVEGTDYTVSYTPNITVGVVNIIITGIGDYKGMMQYVFMIGLDPAVKDDFFVSNDGILIRYRGTQTDVEIPEGLVNVDVGAFPADLDLVRVTFPSTMMYISSYAFDNKSKLAEIQVSENNPNYASQDGVLFNKDKTELLMYPTAKPETEYTVPEGVKTIKSYAFFSCTELAELTIPSSVTAINSQGIDSLTGIQVAAGNPNYCSQDGILFNRAKTALLLYPAKKPGAEYAIPDTVKSIGYWAFYYCSELESLIIPESVTELGSRIIVQGEDGSLKDVYYCGTREKWRRIDNTSAIESYVTVHYNYGKLELTKDMFTVDTEAESYTGSAITKTVTGQDGDTALVEGADYTVSYTDNVSAGTATITITGQGDCVGTLRYTFEIKVVAGADFTIEGGVLKQYTGSGGNVVIPEGVSKIEAKAFEDCTGLTGVTFPSTLTEIGKEAFSGCTGLKRVDIPESVVKIGTHTFADCTGLTHATLSGVDVPYRMFWNCSALTSVDIPEGVRSIGGAAFWGCPLAQVEIPSSVQTIGGSAFAGTKITQLVLPEGVQEVGCDAFSNCSELTSVSIPASVTNVGSGAFSACPKLTDISVDADSPGFTSDGGILFSKDKTTLVAYPAGKAGAYTIPNGVTTIGEEAFVDCKTLTGVTIPNSVTTIGDRAFRGCKQLADVTIPDGVTTVGAAAFDGCDSLLKVVVPDSVTSLGGFVFGSCGKLQTVTLGRGVSVLGRAVFQQCPKLTSVTILGDVTRIEDFAFNLDTQLKDVYFNGSEADWAAIDIVQEYNDPLLNATIHYNYTASQPDPKPTALTKSMFSVDTAQETYTGSAITKTVSSSSLVRGTDYTVAYQNNVSVGTAKIIITGQGAYTGTLEYTFQIVNKGTALSVNMFGVDAAPETYTGSAITKTVSSSSLTRDVDYTVSYENNVSAGIAKIVITGQGDYTGRLEYTFQIRPKLLTASMLKVDTETETYTGSAFTKTVVAMDGDRRLTRAVDYTVTYNNNINLGTATIIINGKGNYEGMEQYTFSIRSTSPQDSDFVYWNGMVTDYRGQGGDVSIPDGVISIPDDVFFLGHVTSVTIPSSVEEISERAFTSSEVSSIQVAEDNANYSSQEGVLFNKDKTRLIQCPPEKAGAYTVPDGVTEIGAQGFTNCSKLTQVMLPITLTSIGSGAFNGCRSLTDIYYAGSEAEWDSVEGRLKPAPGSGLTIHYNYGAFEAASGQLQGESRSLTWSSTADGEVTVTGELGVDEMVLLACYDGQGRLMKAERITGADGMATMRADCAWAKLFWLGGALQPLSPSALVWEQQ